MRKGKLIATDEPYGLIWRHGQVLSDDGQGGEEGGNVGNIDELGYGEQEKEEVFS